MAGNLINKSLGAVLIIAAHLVFIECNKTPVTENVGTNITLKFSFNTIVTNESHFAVYKVKDPKLPKTKIAEYINGSLKGSTYVTYPKNGSVIFNLTNLTLKHSGHYLASLFLKSGGPAESEMVHLIVHEENISSTVTPEDDILITTDSGSSSSSHIITSVLVVLPVVLLTATLVWLIWSLEKTKDKQEPPQHQNSTPTIQETVEAPSQVPAPPVIYSVLDFPKRGSAVLDVNSRDTEYAVVSYLTEKRGM